MKIFTMSFVMVVLLVCNAFLGVAGVDISTQDPGYTHLRRPQGRRLATQQWCVAKPNLGSAYYQGALDWVCGPLSGQGQVNCGPITSGQSCFLPDTYQSHASWAFNVYYQTHGQTAQACDFQGTAMITTTDPSTSTCPYSVSNNVSSNSNGTASGAMGEHMMHSRPLSCLSAIVSVIAYFLTSQAL
ncbi:hypothetical protein M758_11G029500 [Ceratodon purpureus]|uniref:X8 domain-containing protein n=1 Tax=Ceratodon purpureus TaxID=3225 RepID=A0A8T0GAE2_CERPU|nr:hypothetical protein KC19_11G031200 [Ceratodon purpureus]KAG0600385.1 hypothetical protein M758_11G029500 [Ceratodon purpureus]